MKRNINRLSMDPSISEVNLMYTYLWIKQVQSAPEGSWIADQAMVKPALWSQLSKYGICGLNDTIC